MNSQRFLSFLLLVIAGVVMALGGGHVTISTDLVTTVVALAAPFTLIFMNITGLFDVIDSRVAEGTLSPGDLLGMISLKEWWASMIFSVAGLLQIFGYKAIDPTEQAVLVNVALAFITVLLRSVSNRATSDPLSVGDHIQKAFEAKYPPQSSVASVSPNVSTNSTSSPASANNPQG